ncbi:MAG: ATPase, T2SS/T4P/T4SS family [Gammaproteobacteria bacterium]|nr:ATPase, T2SS/T4P/T4SS family [Gammaproteobacteria bacterium]
MNNITSIAIPLPPRCKKPPIQALSRPEPVLINLLDGKSLTGELVSYNDMSDFIEVKPVNDGPSHKIPFSAIKNMQLLNSRYFESEDENENVGSNSLKTEYVLEYIDGTSDMGETLGYISDHQGIHLFVAQAFNSYKHLFISSNALSRKKILGAVEIPPPSTRVVSPVAKTHQIDELPPVSRETSIPSELIDEEAVTEIQAMSDFEAILPSSTDSSGEPEPRDSFEPLPTSAVSDFQSVPPQFETIDEFDSPDLHATPAQPEQTLFDEKPGVDVQAPSKPSTPAPPVQTITPAPLLNDEQRTLDNDIEQIAIPYQAAEHEPVDHTPAVEEFAPDAQSIENAITDRNSGEIKKPVAPTTRNRAVFIPAEDSVPFEDAIPGNQARPTKKPQQQKQEKKLSEILQDRAIESVRKLEEVLNNQAERPSMRLGEALIQDGIITEHQLLEALELQKEDRSKPIGEILKEMGAVSDIEIRKTLASKLGIPFINLRKFDIDPKAVELVPLKMARKHKIMPTCMFDNKLIIAIDNPMNRAPVDDIRFHTKMFVEPVMAMEEDVEWALNHYYGSHIESLAEELTLVDNHALESDDSLESEVTESDNTLVKLVNKMIMDAYDMKASDIHVEPGSGRKNTLIRFRKDGTLQPYVELPATYRNALVSRIKIMCDLDISERRKPQDGKIEFRKFGPLNIELRVATLPTSGNVEDVVLRVLAHGEPLPLENMRFNQRNLELIRKLTDKPYGLFLVCGPTGSGKTTTLHSVLKRINTGDRKIWTAEDPVEITQSGLRQVQVNTKINLTFATAMRAFLRADPDVIMVGEMRDKETTSIGVEASLTGHLVFSTLHTNSAPESIVRLLDMGMDPFNFADALLGILAQRLAKTYCSACKTSYIADEHELRELIKEYLSEFPELLGSSVKMDELLESWRNEYGDVNGDIHLYEAHGCEECGNTGLSGRIALHELLVASDRIKLLIQDRGKVAEILAVALNEGMLTLKQDGILKVLQGFTNIHQVHAVCIK